MHEHHGSQGGRILVDRQQRRQRIQPIARRPCGAIGLACKNAESRTGLKDLSEKCGVHVVAGQVAGDLLDVEEGVGPRSVEDVRDAELAEAVECHGLLEAQQHA